MMGRTTGGEEIIRRAGAGAADKLIIHGIVIRKDFQSINYIVIRKDFQSIHCIVIRKDFQSIHYIVIRKELIPSLPVDRFLDEPVEILQTAVGRSCDVLPP